MDRHGARWRERPWAIGVVLASAVASAPASAHHSQAIYDSDQEVTIDGAVERVDWANPHVYLFIAETLDTGERVVWEVEGSAPSVLRRRGWSQDMLTPGAPIRVSGMPTRDLERHGVFPASIVYEGRDLLDRERIAAEEAAAVAEIDARADSLAGVWAGEEYPSDGGYPFAEPDTLTAAGAEALAAFDDTTDRADCLGHLTPLAMTFHDIKQIRIDGDTVVVAIEGDNIERTVHIGGTHEGAEPSRHGHSIGAWEDEGRTLVVDTTHYLPHPMGNVIALASSAEKHMVERLTLNEDGTRLTYSFVLEDPVYLAEPITGEVDWVYRPDFTFKALDCRLENALRFVQE